MTVARKPGEYVAIGEDIVVKVINDENGRLQLEIGAPEGTDIIPGGMSEDIYQISPEKIVKALNKQADKIQVLDKIAVWKENSIILLDPSTILYFTVVKKKVVVHTKDDTYESNSSLEYLEGRLSNRGFFRCHRSFVINMDYVDKIVPWFNSTYMIKLRSEAEQIPVSRYYTKMLRSLLNI